MRPKVYFEEFDRPEFNFYEFTNISSQAARQLNDQQKLGILEIKNRTVISEAINKVLDGRIVKLEETQAD
ncbi:MAG: hypothetical protein ACLFQK_03115 [Fibrobacterota bacterium]